MPPSVRSTAKFAGLVPRQDLVVPATALLNIVTTASCPLWGICLRLRVARMSLDLRRQWVKFQGLLRDCSGWVVAGALGTHGAAYS